MTDTNAVATQEFEAAVAFAGFIVEQADRDNLAPTVVFNGMAMAAAACLADYVADENGNIDEMSMLYALTNFKAGLDKAVEFAQAQVKAVIAAQQAE